MKVLDHEPLDHEPNQLEVPVRKSQKFRKAAVEQASAAAEYGQKALKEGVAKAQVVLEEGVQQTQELLTKLQEQAVPKLHQAKVRSADFAARKFDAIEPHLRDALDRVQPTVESARDKVAGDLLPRLSAALHEAAEHPSPVVHRKSRAKTLLKLLAFAGLLAGAVAAVRHFLAPKDDGWTAHEPSRAYVNNNDTFATAAKVAAEAAEAEVVEDAEPAQDTPEPSSKYGPDSYVGDEPPAEYTIKGNERSMKYHLPGSNAYDRTIAEVWFATEEAAEAAGFSKAQR